MIPDLPEGWSARTATADDADVILPVVHASDIAALGYPDFTADEVRETLTEPRTESWLVFAGPSAVAWGYLSNETGGTRDVIDIYVRPGEGEAAQPPLLAAGLSRIASRGLVFGHGTMTARAGAVPTEHWWISVLAAQGFAFVKRYARMKVSLPAVVPAAVPDGVSIAPLRYEDEADLRRFCEILDVAFRDTPDYLPLPFDAFREQIAALPRVRWDEWFVATVDGVPAGVLQSSDSSADEGEGWVDKLAVLAEYRGRGIGRALLSTAFATYTARGLTVAGLGVDLVNPTGAYALYESVGMRPAYEIDIYEKSVAAGGA